jgi:hypothetical protein
MMLGFVYLSALRDCFRGTRGLATATACLAGALLFAAVWNLNESEFYVQVTMPTLLMIAVTPMSRPKRAAVGVLLSAMLVGNLVLFAAPKHANPFWRYVDEIRPGFAQNDLQIDPRTLVAEIPIWETHERGAPTPGQIGAQATTGLIAPDRISYLGAFGLEEQWAPDYSTWEYSNGAVAYYPDGDPTGPGDGYPGSLFMAGHVYSSKVAELEIPVPVISRSVSELPVARVLQPMTDVTAGLPGKDGFILGMTYMPSQGRIYFTHGQDYSDSGCDPSNSPPGLGSFKPTLSSPATNGLWFLAVGGATLHPFTSLRYIMEVPQAWADANLKGNSLATGRHRGWCPEGTNLYASAPWTTANPRPPGSKIPAATLMEFGDIDTPSKWSKEHGRANAYQGGAWLTSGNEAGVVISGIIDDDPSRGYYGYDNWKSPSECDPNPEAKGCTGARGWRAAAPKPALLFYRPSDFADVVKGRKKPGEVAWYAKLDLSKYMLRSYPPTLLTTDGHAEDLLMTFDRSRGLIYISESFVDGLKPVVHVFRLGGASSF